MDLKIFHTDKLKISIEHIRFLQIVFTNKGTISTKDPHYEKTFAPAANKKAAKYFALEKQQKRERVRIIKRNKKVYANNIGLSKTTITDKLNNKFAWTMTEVGKLADYWGLDPHKFLADALEVAGNQIKDDKSTGSNPLRLKKPRFLMPQSDEELEEFLRTKLVDKLQDPNTNLDDLYDQINDTQLQDQDTYGLAAREDKTGQHDHLDNED